MAAIDVGVAVVADAGPLIHLDELAALVLLTDFESVIIPEAVWHEVERHRPTALVDPPGNFQRLQPPSTMNLQLVQLGTALALARGELEALQILEHRRGHVFLTDDGAARMAATQLGHRVHGTIGILLRAVRRGMRTPREVEELLLSIPIRSTLHVRKDLLQAAVAELHKAFPAQ